MWGNVAEKIGAFAARSRDFVAAHGRSGLNSAKANWNRGGWNAFAGGYAARGMRTIGQRGMLNYDLSREIGKGRWASAMSALATHGPTAAKLAGHWLTAGNLRGRRGYRAAASAARIWTAGAALDFVNPFGFGSIFD